MMEQYFNYDIEPVNETLCIDMKSFYASVECVVRGLNPLTTMLVVMSNADSGGGLALATSPMAKKRLGISNVTRKHEIPYHKDLLIVPPRMNLYIKENIKINNIFRRYVADEDILIYSIDETFVRVQGSQKLFNMDGYGFARQFQQDILKETGLYCTIGIGDNMLLSKLALDNEAKHNHDMIATWRYSDVPTKVWGIKNMTDFWGINTKTEARFMRMGIRNIKDLAHYDFFKMKEKLGVIGQQHIAHAWGIDRTNISEKYQPASKSIGNSQVLMRDYTHKEDIKVVIREMAEQVATRIRAKGYQTGCVHLSIGYSQTEIERGFSRQMKVQPTNQSKKLVGYCFELFEKYYTGKVVRSIAISYSKLTEDNGLQLNLFENPQETVNQKELDDIIDHIRQRYGFPSIVHASSKLEAGTAIDRSTKVGGHAGGTDGL